MRAAYVAHACLAFGSGCCSFHPLFARASTVRSPWLRWSYDRPTIAIRNGYWRAVLAPEPYQSHNYEIMSLHSSSLPMFVRPLKREFRYRCDVRRGAGSAVQEEQSCHRGRRRCGSREREHAHGDPTDVEGLL